MTKKERAQVVELLRCAADVEICGEFPGCGLGTAATRGRFSSAMLGVEHWTDLLEPMRGCQWRNYNVCGTGYEFVLLEFAARVEEGSWP